MAVVSLPEGPVPFGAFLTGRGAGRSLRQRRGRTHALSIAFHAGLLLAGVIYSVQPGPAPVPRAVSVSLALPRFAPPPPPAGTPAPTPAPVRKPIRPAPVLVPAPIPPTAPAAPAVEEEAGVGGEGVETDGVAGGEKGGVPGGTVGAPPPPPPPPAVPRAALLDRYLREVVRGRVAAQFRYPPEAEALALEGTVVVRLTIDHAGTLLAATDVGSCPHDLLCEAARRTARAAAPFPPPPPELAGNVQVDVPLTYRLD